MLYRLVLLVLVIAGLAGCGRGDEQTVATPENLPEGGREAGDQWVADYVGSCYYHTCDAWSPDWDLRGAAEDIELFRTIIEDFGNSTRWPQWKAGSEFKAIREQSADVRLAR